MTVKRKRVVKKARIAPKKKAPPAPHKGKRKPPPGKFLPPQLKKKAPPEKFLPPQDGKEP